MPELQPWLFRYFSFAHQSVFVPTWACSYVILLELELKEQESDDYRVGGHVDLTFNFTLPPTEQEIRISRNISSFCPLFLSSFHISSGPESRDGLDATGSKASRRGVKFEISISTAISISISSRLPFWPRFRGFFCLSLSSRVYQLQRIFLLCKQWKRDRRLETHDAKWAMVQWQDHMPKSSWVGLS